jgi:hypothetical protein
MGAIVIAMAREFQRKIRNFVLISSTTNKVIIIILVLIRRTYTLFHYNFTDYRKSDNIVLRITAIQQIPNGLMALKKRHQESEPICQMKFTDYRNYYQTRRKYFRPRS